MLHLFSANSASFIAQIQLTELLNAMPESVKKKALRYRFKRDAYNFILGRLLLKRGLREFGLELDFEKIYYNQNGKPLLNGIFFNISHSDHLVVCALNTTGEIGVDIEMVKPIPLDDFKNWFTQKEWQHIYDAENPLRQFYWYWTRKESIIKALGINLSYLNKIEIDAAKAHFETSGKKWYLEDFDLGSRYFGAVCTEREIGPFQYNIFTPENF